MERPQSDISVDEDAVGIHIEKIQMKKSINLLHCTAILVAVTGHVSIFISPTMILANTGSVGLTLIMWIVGGFINLSLALCFTELGTMFPVSGGPYVYILNVFGPLPAFMLLWGYFLLINGPFWAFVSYGASVYILQPFFPTCRPPEIGVKILGGWILVTFVALNGVYMKYVTKVQTFLSSTKVIGLLLIVVCGVIQLVRGETDHFENIMANSKTDLGSISFAAFFSTFSYGGWQVISSLMEETKNPARDLPRAVYITFFIVMTVYILTNVAFFTVLSPTELLRSDAVAVLFMQNFYGPLTPVITILVGLCCIGVLNASIMGHSRVLFAGARNGHFPSIFGTLQTTFLTPWAAILAITFLALFLLFSGGLVLFIEYIQVFSIIMTLMVLSALLYLRRYRPDMKRPYKVNIALPIVMLVINFVMLLICVITEPTRTGMALVLFFTGVPVYLFGVIWKSKPKSFNDVMYKTTVILQKTFLLGKAE
ncbi:cystine/glutamate transporter-like [Mytilus edulis]|uniref:cystine/glutamate transporter-like n=1 Tax=Mytilus edulis TaxID=6550 RepID=UPI0039EF2936